MKKLIAALVLSAVLTACGGLTRPLRIGLAVSRPFVQSLVTSGVINQAKADAVIADISEGIDDVRDCEATINAIAKTDPARKAKKAQAYFDLAQKLRGILRRENIGGNPALDRIATVVQGAIDALEEYFNQVNPPAAGGTVSVKLRSKKAGATTTAAEAHAVATPTEDPDKVLERKMKKAVSDLKNLIK